MIINEDFFDSQEIDISPSEITNKADGAIMSHTMTLTVVRGNGLSVKKLDTELIINRIKNILNKCDLFTDYSFESVGFSETYNRENEEVYTFNDDIPPTDYLYRKYSAGKPLSRLVVTFTFNVMPDEDVSKTVFAKQFYHLCNKLDDITVYHSSDTAQIEFTDNASGKTSNQIFFNETTKNEDASSIYEVLYGIKDENIALDNVIQKLNFRSIYTNAFRAFENDEYFTNMAKYISLGPDAEVEEEMVDDGNGTQMKVTYLHIHVENKTKVSVGTIYKTIQLLVFNQIPLQYMIRNYTVVVLHLSNEKLVDGLSRKTVDIPIDTRPDGIRKLRLAAVIKPVEGYPRNVVQPTARLCNVRYLNPSMRTPSYIYIVTPKKNGYIYSKDINVSNLYILEVLKHIITKYYGA